MYHIKIFDYYKKGMESGIVGLPSILALLHVVGVQKQDIRHVFGLVGVRHVVVPKGWLAILRIADRVLAEHTILYDAILTLVGVDLYLLIICCTIFCYLTYYLSKYFIMFIFCSSKMIGTKCIQLLKTPQVNIYYGRIKFLILEFLSLKTQQNSIIMLIFSFDSLYDQKWPESLVKETSKP